MKREEDMKYVKGDVVVIADSQLGNDDYFKILYTLKGDRRKFTIKKGYPKLGQYSLFSHNFPIYYLVPEAHLDPWDAKPVQMGSRIVRIRKK